MSHRHSGYFVLAGALALALALACGDDETPTGGGGGNNSSTLTIPPGTYQSSGGFYDCVTHMPTDTSPIDTMVLCSNEVVDEFFGYDCPVKRNGNNLTLSCTRTTEMSTGCFETVVIDIKGTVSGDHYELHGTFNVSDNPADCWNGSYCDSFAVSLDKIGPAPSACTYADAGTIALTVVGGAQAGKHTLGAFGGSDNVSGNIAFYFNASSGFTAAVAPHEFTTRGINGISMYGDTSYLDPTGLPHTLQVYVAPPNATAGPASAGGPQIALSYYENNGNQQFNATSAVSGNFVVRELDDDHIAGTLNVTLGGTQYDSANPGGIPSQRTLTGGYYILGSTPLATAPGVFDRILSGRHTR